MTTFSVLYNQFHIKDEKKNIEEYRQFPQMSNFTQIPKMKCKKIGVCKEILWLPYYISLRINLNITHHKRYVKIWDYCHEMIWV